MGNIVITKNLENGDKYVLTVDHGLPYVHLELFDENGDGIDGIFFQEWHVYEEMPDFDDMEYEDMITHLENFIN